MMDINKTVRALRAEPINQPPEYYIEKYKEFYEKYPKLFQAAIDHKFDLLFLDLMVARSTMVNNNSMSLDNADKEIYDVLRENYITPVLGE